MKKSGRHLNAVIKRILGGKSMYVESCPQCGRKPKIEECCVTKGRATTKNYRVPKLLLGFETTSQWVLGPP